MVKEVKQKFHYQHHRVEAIRTRRRFAVLNVLLFSVAAVAIGVQYVGSHAASSTTADLDGVKIINTAGSYYGGTNNATIAAAIVTAKRVSNSVVTTTKSNPFYMNGLGATSAGDHYIVTVTAVPGYTVKGLTWCSDPCTNYDELKTNFRSGSSTDFTFYAGMRYHMRWLFEAAPVATPAPATPAPVPVAVAPAPVKTPVKTIAKTPTPKPAAVVAVATPAPPAPAADTVAPSVPGALQALAAGDNALVKLSWTASTDNVGVVSYHLERSSDKNVWGVVADVSELEFQDATAAFGVHYYYRLSAFDAAGNHSGYATADATTVAFAGADSQAVQTFSTSDSLVRVTVPNGAFDGEVDCTIVASKTKVVAGKKSVMGGPNQLICKDSSGNQVIATKQPIKWSYVIKSKMGGFTKPQGYSVDGGGSQVLGSQTTYDKTTGTLTFTTANLGTTVVLASAKAGLPIVYIIFVVVAVVLIAAIFILMLRGSQKTNYDDYIRSKYYDL